MHKLFCDRVDALLPPRKNGKEDAVWTNGTGKAGSEKTVFQEHPQPQSWGSSLRFFPVSGSHTIIFMPSARTGDWAGQCPYFFIFLSIPDW